jgi:ATP-binding cassette subfamily F protein uup
MAAHDQNDYTGLGEISAELSKVDADAAALETRWLELHDLLEG